ncbi:LuxR C-terminal-related transcriptional regulator [Salinibacterium sp. ZJ450]|uniref:LuxR C-terminal-related transcriptional regulator n=1 Tax=Salinibacterium sp. ZJ450 TaxID=2708338 RepID=UPI0014248929|nr:LuxR C-terminal-related transcriptional regulator [Salinibacterium sp. ZJ450]
MLDPTDILRANGSAVVGLSRDQNVDEAETEPDTLMLGSPGERARLVRELILSMPEETWVEDPAMLLALAASFRAVDSVNAVAALPYLDSADGILAAGDRDCSLIVVARLLRAIIYRALGRLVDAAEQAEFALRLADTAAAPLTERITLRALALIQLGICGTLLGQHDDARSALQQGMALGGDHLARDAGIEALGCLALIDFSSGSVQSTAKHLAAAEELMGAAMTSADLPCAPVSLAQAFVALECGRVTVARDLASALTASTLATEYEPLTLHVSALLLMAEGQFLEALEVLSDEQILIRGWQSPRMLQSLHDADRANALIHVGEMPAARQLITRLTADAHHALCPARLAALLELTTGNLADALAAAEGCLTLGDDHAPRTSLYIEVLRAAAHDALGDSGIAAAGTDRALAHAARTGERRAFTTLPADRLLSLLKAAGARPQPAVRRSVIDDLLRSVTDSSQPAISPLTDRERVVLRRIASGESVKRIAAELQVSPNTVKSQVRSIYRKLGASNRHEAVNQASAFGIAP